MKYLIAFLLIASPLLAQRKIIDRYFPYGIGDNTFWVFDLPGLDLSITVLTKGYYWTPFSSAMFYKNDGRWPEFNFAIFGNKIGRQTHEFQWDEYNILADFDLNRGDHFLWSVIIAGNADGFPYVFADSAFCVSTDTTLIAKLGTLRGCYLFFLEGAPWPFMEWGSYHNKMGSFIYYAPGIGFASSNLIYAKIGNFEYGKLPDGLTKNDLISPYTSAPNVKEQFPGSFTLAQNYPNPFNSETVIEFNLPQFSEINLAVYNVSGREIKTIFSGQLPLGAYSEKWNGTDDSGNAVASGVYFIRLKSGQYSKFIKAVYSK